MVSATAHPRDALSHSRRHGVTRGPAPSARGASRESRGRHASDVAHAARRVVLSKR